MWSWSVVDIVLSRPIHSANSCHLYIGLSATADRQLEEIQESIFSINHRKRRKNAKICVTNPQPGSSISFLSKSLPRDWGHRSRFRDMNTLFIHRHIVSLYALAKFSDSPEAYFQKHLTTSPHACTRFSVYAAITRRASFGIV
jgi:hypothetical protein